MGKLIVLEGTDSSGKATQSEILYKNIQKKGYKVKKIDFPNYDSGSSIFVKNYLNGDYGRDAESVDPYIASTFYTLDRYETLMRGVKDFYNDGGILISDRYTTSSMIHQASKFDNQKDKDKYLDWLIDFEYNIFGLPRPDMVIFLDLPTKFSNKLITKRNNKIDGSSKKDIHESNKEYMEKSYQNAKYVADKYKWENIECYRGESMLSKDEIKGRIYSKVRKII